MKLVAVLAAFAAAVVFVSSAVASPAGGACRYKMTTYPIYMNISGSGVSAVCDIVGQSAGGSLIRIYTSAHGQIRCGFYNRSVAARMNVYSPSPLYGPLACSLLNKSLGRSGWTKLF